MRLCVGLASAFLLAAVHASVTKVELNVGDSRVLSVLSIAQTVEACHVVNPSNEQFDFIPDDVASSTDKYGILEGNVGARCQVTVYNIDKNDEGTWELYFTNEGVRGGSQQFEFTVIASESLEEEEEDEDKDITLLQEIIHRTTQDALIDISLDKRTFEENCYVRPPGSDEMIEAELLNIEGVKVQDKSLFVSCRITISPATESLLGVWRLCGKSVETGKIRCQPANISWNRNNGALWASTTHERFNHPIHLGGAIHPGVTGDGTVITCHVVTPFGEDLVITEDVSYPHIERMFEYRSTCSILIRDFADYMISNWAIYGRFDAILGQNEVKLPINVFLYNDANPYEQAYNATLLPEAQHLVHVGTDLTLEVSQTRGTVEDCIVKAPSGETWNLPSTKNLPAGVTIQQNSNVATCQIEFSPISEEVLGEWQIIGRFSHAGLFDEHIKHVTIIKEDPANPIPDIVEREIQNMSEQTAITSMDSTLRFLISSGNFIESQSCHLITPDGLQYAFIDGFNVPGVEILQETGVDCGIRLTLSKEDMIGQYTLISRATMITAPIERRLPFTVRVEENFVIQHDINISEGADLYLHLDDVVSMPDTCKLYHESSDEEFTDYEADTPFPNSCRYIIRNVSQTHSGRWIIENGYRIKYRGSINVNVLEPSKISVGDLQWTVGDAIDMAVGPESAVYCKVEDSSGTTRYDDFGQCKIVLDSVTIDHRGIWKLFVAAPGSVLLEEYEFLVNVYERDAKPTVSTAVVKNAPSIILICAIPINFELNACKFRDPQGNILVAAPGVGQDGYMFNGTMINYESDVQSHECSLRLINPSVSDLGIWRCALDTSTGTYYGFPTVSHLLVNADDAINVITEPILKPERETFNFVEGESAVMSCSAAAQLRYCYFRARNGTVFNVFPTMSSGGNFEYVGAGLDAGDCGIRFRGLSVNERGQWSCHAGLVDTSEPEQRTIFAVEVIARMVVRHGWQSQRLLVVDASVYQPNTIEYCRYVKRNGEGFTSDNLPRGYSMGRMSDGRCTLHIHNPDMIDLHPWAVAIKIEGKNGEISRTTTENLLYSYRSNILGEMLFWIFILTLCLIPLAAATMLIPSKNRKWTYRRASRLRSSVRNSWNNTFSRKSPAATTTAPTTTTTAPTTSPPEYTP